MQIIFTLVYTPSCISRFLNGVSSSFDKTAVGANGECWLEQIAELSMDGSLDFSGYAPTLG